MKYHPAPKPRKPWRTAKRLVKEYRERGYSDERIRAIATTRDDTKRSEILEILEG